jgi:hypothetical protein
MLQGCHTASVLQCVIRIAQSLLIMCYPNYCCLLLLPLRTQAQAPAPHA